MLVQLAAQFFVLVALKLFSINVFNFLIIILKFSIKKKIRIDLNNLNIQRYFDSFPRLQVF